MVYNVHRLYYYLHQFLVMKAFIIIIIIIVFMIHRSHTKLYFKYFYVHMTCVLYYVHIDIKTYNRNGKMRCTTKE